MFYGEGAYAFRQQLSNGTESNKAAAIGFIASRQLTLGTCLGEGVVKSLRMIHSSKSKYRAVIVAGDGRPTVCPFVRGAGRNPQMIQRVLSQTQMANPGMQSKVHTILVGSRQSSDDVDFMRKLANLHNGTFKSVTQ